MTPTTNDKMETGVRELFDRQADAFAVAPREWDDAPLAGVTNIAERRARRRVLGATIAAISVGAIAVAVLAVVGVGGNTTHVTTKNPPVANQGGTGNPVHFHTSLVDFSASDFTITANGKVFTTAGSHVSLNSDPGDPTYWTLELGWTEHGVRMLTNFYFASDGHSWWVTEIRTYNGKPNGDWIEYMGNRFKTPLGSAFTGNVDLMPSDHTPGASFHLGGLRITTNPQRFDCQGVTGAYTVAPDFADTFAGSPGMTLADGHVTVLETKTCAAPPDPARFSVAWASGDASIVEIGRADCVQLVDPAACRLGAYFSVRSGHVGHTTVHATIRDTKTGTIVGTHDFPAVVSENGAVQGAPAIGSQAGVSKTAAAVPVRGSK